MRKEALIFVGATIATILVAGAIGTAGLFVYGFAWLVYGDD